VQSGDIDLKRIKKGATMGTRGASGVLGGYEVKLYFLHLKYKTFLIK
jgi:hypothetical protein